MIDKMLGIGASFDYVGPTVKVLGDLLHGGSYTFLIPPCDTTGSQVERLLRGQGVTAWGSMIVDNTQMISVRKADATRAYDILQGAGVPVENPPKMAKSAPKRRPERQGSPFGVFDSVFGGRCQYCGVMLSAGSVKCSQCGAPR